MTIDELIVQGTMFPNFDGTEYPYRVLHFGQGNDSIRLEMNEVMDLTLKTWRPPIWASQKAHQKRQVLRDKERASQAQAREGDPPDLKLTAVRGTYPQSVPETPRIVLTARRGLPLWKKGKRGCPKLPLGAPSIYAPVDDWSDDCDKSFKLPRMFPRALGSSLCPDNDEAENVWLHKLIKLLAVKGQYRALLEWAEVAPANGTPVPWEGEFTCSATLADVTTYLVANGVTYHNANNALNNGGDKDPNTKVIINQMRATLNELLPMGEHHSLQWIDLQACVLGVLPENIMPYKECPIKERDLFALEEFTKLAALYDLSHQTRGEGSNTGGVVPIPASTLKEGEMEDDSRPM
ncbi:hypothetical protein EDC04DRAFT_2599409 [Pisolithus marmoratus]|nr:hypothetical protein EDC04DRAFT_2599409 [Pisolithus marmoratus]